MDTENLDVKSVQRHWCWLLGLGIFFLILGFIGLGMVISLTIVSMYFFAALLVISGISHLVDGFKHCGWQGMIWQVLVAFLYLGAGAVVFYDPVLASTLITAMLAGALIFIGLVRIVMAFSLKTSTGWLWMLLAGVSALILGFLILMQWPISGLWVIGLFIAIDMMMTGWTYIFISCALKRQ